MRGRGRTRPSPYSMMAIHLRKLVLRVRRLMYAYVQKGIVHPWDDAIKSSRMWKGELLGTLFFLVSISIPILTFVSVLFRVLVLLKMLGG